MREFVMTEDIVLARWQFLEAEAPHGECFADECPLAAYDLEGNEVRAPFDTSTAIAAAQNGEIWVTNGRGGDLHLWSPVEHREEWVGKYGPIALSGLENGVAYVDEDALVYLLEEGKAPRSIGTIDRYREAADLLGMFTCGNRLAAYWRWNEPQMQTWSLEEPSEDIDTITLVNCADWYDDCMNAAITMWKEAHPDGSVQFADLSGEQLNTALMAKDAGLDILYLGNYDVMNYVRAGVLEDLNDWPEVTEQLDHWIDMDGASTWMGTRFGVLMGVNISCLQLNEALVNYLPEELNPEQLSWRQLMEAGVGFRGDVNGDGKMDVHLWRDARRFPAFLFQYMAAFDDPADVNFDTEEFRQLMALYRQCEQNGAYANLYGSDDPDSAILSVGDLTALNAEKHMPLPSLEQEGAPTTTCSVFAIGVNRNSANKALAIELLADYASVQAQSANGFSDEQNRHYGFSFLKDSAVHEAYASLTDVERKLLEENKALFARAKLNRTVKDFTPYCGDQIEAYLDGAISLDELIQNLQHRLQMVLMG